MESGSDNRKFARKTLSQTVSIFDQDNNEYLGIMADFSEGGVMVSSAAPMNVGRVYRLLMVDIPNTIGQKRNGTFTAESVWSNKINSTMYGTGFKLCDLSSSAKEMFKSYDDT